ncbi:glycerate kinase [Duganella callida]|uniref:Glycerate kinase n=1 Tax=Duganella callida TaxID=2561932 RepID=A0A4Y9SBE1_9BURK|nr:glycerate kinase [Duganella callida]TFW19366.1 glycerate kinase [Duganella callida]
MKIVIAPDSFKESLTAMAVANEIEAGFREIFPDAEYLKLPVADGGEGTVQAMIDASGGRRVALDVTGPLGEPVSAFYGLMGDGQTAVIEMAAASGLELVPPARRNPLRTTSYGTGQLILDALERGARRFVLGIGGSATNDGGAGMLQALGGRLLDATGAELPAGGGALNMLDRIDLSNLDARINDCVFDVACDVSNPLVGPQGASAIFGPQKGATTEMVARLDDNLRHYAAVIARDLGQDVAEVPGAGAGGGIGAAMLVFLNGRLRPGSEIVTAAVGLDAAVADADLVITGEGRIDGQTIQGKTPVGVARVAQRHGKPVIAIGGSLACGAAAVHAHGIAAVFGAVSRPCTVEEALAAAAVNVRSAARNIAAALRLGAALGAGPGL